MIACALLLTACARPADEPSRATPTKASSSLAPSPLALLTGKPRITARIAVPDGAFGSGVAVGAGSAWVGVQPQKRNGNGSVLRIDLATNKVVAEIPVAEAPSRKRIAATDDAVWVGSTGLLERVDPATNAVVATVAIPDRSISAIAADGAAVWAITIDRSNQGLLVRVDPATNEIVAEVPLGPQIAGYEDEVQVGAGSVWVLGVRWSSGRMRSTAAT
jgi:DNA-binding beta-propeller fold protein YncE